MRITRLQSLTYQKHGYTDLKSSEQVCTIPQKAANAIKLQENLS